MSGAATCFPGIPSEVGNFGYVVCVDLHGRPWQAPGAAWIAFLDDAASSLNVRVARGYTFSGQCVKTADFKGKKAEGSWSRIRTRASAILGLHSEKNLAEVRSGFDFNLGESADDFCLQLEQSKFDQNTRQRVSVAAASKVAATPDDLLESLTRSVGDRLVPIWGAAFKFPMAAGPVFYLMEGTYAGAALKSMGNTIELLAAHSERVHRAKLRNLTDFDYSKGYVRELYEINLLSERHMNARLHESNVRDYTEKVGVLRRSSIADLWDWWLTADELERARAHWENSGLVLAAEREPLVI